MSNKITLSIFKQRHHLIEYLYIDKMDPRNNSCFSIFLRSYVLCVKISHKMYSARWRDLRAQGEYY